MIKMQEATKRVGDSNIRNRAVGDFPSNLLARILRCNPPIGCEAMSRDGDVEITVPLRSLGMCRNKMAKTPLTRTTFFINFLGEILVRKNIGVFAKMLDEIDAKQYDSTVNCYKHRHFGMYLDEHEVLRFQFHISLAQRILTEEMSDIFTPHTP